MALRISGSLAAVVRTSPGRVLILYPWQFLRNIPQPKKYPFAAAGIGEWVAASIDPVLIGERHKAG